jgi:hypothetical protein
MPNKEKVFMDKTEELETVKIACANCGGTPKNHLVVKEFQVVQSDKDGFELSGEIYQICQCKGCDSIRFRKSAWDDIVGDTKDSTDHIYIYPDASGQNRAKIKTTDLPDTVSRIYTDTITAFNSGAMILAGGGLRAIVEAICIDQGVSGDNLQKKINNLVVKGLLAETQADLLHEERYIGNAALHELISPEKHDIEEGLLIIEGLINTIYILPKRAKRLKQSRKSREIL